MPRLIHSSVRLESYKIPALQIVMIGLRIFRVVLNKPPGLLARNFQTQSFADVAGDLFLKDENVVHFMTIMLAPNL